MLDHSNAIRPYTNVVINGVETSALLDTGATIPLIGDRFVDSDLAPYAEEKEARILGVGGQKFYPVTRIEALAIGDDIWTNLRVAVKKDNQRPLQKSILPITLFDTRVVDFDFHEGRVHLYDGKPKRVKHELRTRTSFQTVNELMFIPVKINGRSGLALIDTGADLSFVNAEFAERANALLDEEHTALIRGSDLKRNHVSIYRFKVLRFADNEIKKFTLPVLDTELFAELGFEDQPMMIIGMDLLKQFRVQVDREREHLYFVHARNRSRSSSKNVRIGTEGGRAVR